MAIGKQPSDGGGDGEEEFGDAGLFAEINITPLTDVFLVMLIIFMISALAVQANANQKIKQADQATKKVEQDKRSGLKVNLPSGAAQEIDPSKASLVLVIPVSGDIQANGKIIPESDLDNLLRAAYARDKTTQVVLQVDRGVPHGRVVDLMERAKHVGLTRLAFGTNAGGGK
ncbi:MAG: biopolymer transporter ExbD [Deltaproteobacteria bacterium]|nr:biopolymer transporter ExbD [Deltaproteobacteria bacterium]